MEEPRPRCGRAWRRRAPHTAVLDVPLSLPAPDGRDAPRARSTAGGRRRSPQRACSPNVANLGRRSRPEHLLVRHWPPLSAVWAVPESRLRRYSSRIPSPVGPRVLAIFSEIITYCRTSEDGNEFLRRTDSWNTIVQPAKLVTRTDELLRRRTDTEFDVQRPVKMRIRE